MYYVPELTLLTGEILLFFIQMLSFCRMDCHIIQYFISMTIGIWTKTTCPSTVVPS